MVEAECQKTGKELLKKYNNCIYPEECFGGFIEYAQKARNELERAMTDYRLNCSESISKSSKLSKLSEKIKSQEDKMKKDATDKNPEIKIGKLTYKFYDLLMDADINLRLNGKVDMFEEFKKEEFVEDAIKAFN